MKVVLYFFLFLALANSCVADSLVYMQVHKPLIEEHVKQAKDLEAERVNTLRNLFQKDGCPQVVEQAVPEEQSPNLICILPGIEEGTILVVAALDYPAEDARNPAHWSALALLPLLAKSLAGVPHRSTLVLIAVPGHGHGNRGATQYLSQLTKVQRKTLRGVVDLDNFGQAPAAYALGQPDKTLSAWLQEAAHSLHLAAPPMVEAKSREEDLEGNTQPFVKAGIPSISLRSVPPDSVTSDVFNFDIYDDTYRLLCIYVLYLDGNLAKPPIKLGTYSGTLLDTAGFFGSRTIDFSTEIGRFTTVAELERFKTILTKGGQDALADALEKSTDVGSYRVALRLGTGLKMAVLQTSGKTPAVFLVAVRLQRTGQEDSLHDYRFDVIQLNVDGKGYGDASYYDSAKLRFNSQDELEIEDRRYMPDEVRQVHLQAPAPKTPAKVN